jgi:DNA-binding CsgD family transcriptional regulator
MSFQRLSDPAPPQAASPLPAKSRAGKALSPRETQVAHALARGEAPGEIARRLGLSPKTVSAFRARVFAKLEVHSTAELAVWFERQQQPNYRQALADLVAFIERQRDNSDNRCPEPDMTCAVCTQGVSAPGELCALHRARRLVK